MNLFPPLNFEDLGDPFLEEEKRDEKSEDSPSVKSGTSDMETEPNVSSNRISLDSKNLKSVQSSQIDFNELRLVFGFPHPPLNAGAEKSQFLESNTNVRAFIDLTSIDKSQEQTMASSGSKKFTFIPYAVESNFLHESKTKKRKREDENLNLAKKPRKEANEVKYSPALLEYMRMQNTEKRLNQIAIKIDHYLALNPQYLRLKNNLSSVGKLEYFFDVFYNKSKNKKSYKNFKIKSNNKKETSLQLMNKLKGLHSQAIELSKKIENLYPQIFQNIPNIDSISKIEIFYNKHFSKK